MVVSDQLDVLRSLTKVERNYSQLEKEGLSCVFGVKRFHDYLVTSYCILITSLYLPFSMSTVLHLRHRLGFVGGCCFSLHMSTT